jgi:diguanylate cyclase (GGDEF)-like protein/PAS domain S-box-containing protein
VNLVFTPFAAVLHLAALISGSVAFLAFRRRNTPGAGSLTLLMLSVAEWALASSLEAAAIGEANKLFWSKVEYLGAVSTPIIFLIFTLAYNQQMRWLKWRYLLLISAVPVIAFFFATTNESHHLIWTSLTPSLTQSNTYIYGHGPLYFILVGYDYLLVLTGIVILLRRWLNSKSTNRTQVGIILLGSLFPLATGLVYSLDLNPFPGLDITPVSFSCTGLVLAFGILKFRLLDLVPLARDVLIENLEDGVIVLDLENRIVDINPVAQKLIGDPGREVIGQPANIALKFLPIWTEQAGEPSNAQTEISTDTVPPRFFELRISPLYDHRKRESGKVILFREITDRRHTEKDLARNIEELDIINRISLAVTSGLDMEHVLKTLHQQCSQVAPMDIFYVALYDEANSLIHVPLFYERGHYQAGPSRDIRDHPGLIGTAIQQRQTLYLNNTNKLDTHPLNQPTSILEKTARSYIGIPLTLRERVIGVMTIQSYRPNSYTDDQIRILERIAIQAAIAIENARLYAEVQRLAIVDELTGLYNYRGLLELGTREVNRARRFNRPLSILFSDIDDFRNFNNTYSHSTGNLILKSVSQCFQKILRSVDTITRYGGDEFVALLPETDNVAAETVARRLVEEVANMEVETPFGKMSVTMSIGVTTLCDEDADLNALIDRANHAEHKAKSGQKGIVTVV